MRNNLTKDDLNFVRNTKCHSKWEIVPGIFTDGDLRRAFRKKKPVLDKPVSQLMTKKPKTIKKDQLATEALRVMEDLEIDELPVVDELGCCIGIVDIQDLLKAGVI